MPAIRIAKGTVFVSALICVYVCMYVYIHVASIGKCLYELLAVQTFRPDRVLSAANKFVSAVMGDSFQSRAEQELDLASIVNNEVLYYFI